MDKDELSRFATGFKLIKIIKFFWMNIRNENFVLNEFVFTDIPIKDIFN